MLIRAIASKAALVGLGTIIGLQITTHPTGPTEREIIEILADYDVRHVPDMPGVPFYGMTDHDKRVIYIVDNQDFSSKRGTVIHELAHIMKRMRLEQDDEEEIRIIEEAEYKRLFAQ